MTSKPLATSSRSCSCSPSAAAGAVEIFSNLRFSAASVSITAAFFALFGFTFLITQYFQLIRGYGPLEGGVRTLPVAISIAIASITAPRFVQRIGTTQVVHGGLAMMSIAFLWIALRTTVDEPYIEIVGQMIFLGAGLGATTAPATESIMGALSADKAGVGSAVNDTTRELGGTLGVAIIGSVKAIESGATKKPNSALLKSVYSTTLSLSPFHLGPDLLVFLNSTKLLRVKINTGAPKATAPTPVLA